MLHRYMSEPTWTSAQEAEADRLCAAVEAELEGALYGARISPVELVETAPITREGLVQTALPVIRVLELDGAALPEGTPLPPDYQLRPTKPGCGGRLFHVAVTSGVAGALEVGWPWVAPLAVLPPYTGGVVRVSYLGGWGPAPQLVEAILRKAATRMGNRHGDTVVTNGLSATATPPRPPENFTTEDLAALGPYRNLGWGG